MLAKSLVVSSLAAVALAAANPAPAVTAAPAVRRQFGDLGDDLDGLLDGLGTNIKDIIGDLGTKANDLESGGSSLLGNIGDLLGSATGCLAAMAQLTDMPFPDGDLASVIMTAAPEHSGNPCSVAAAIPKSLSDDYESYMAEASSWAAKNSDKIESIAKACPTVDDDFAQVTDCVAGLSDGKGGADGKDGDDDGDDDGEDDDDDDDSSAARLTGIVAAVAGAAVGAVALLL